MSRDVPEFESDQHRGNTDDRRRHDGERRGPTRRGVMRGAAISLTAGGALATLPLGLGQETVPTILLGGLTEAWQGIAPDSIADQDNPTLELVAGQRYRIIWRNEDGQPHDITIEDADGNQLQVLEVVDATPEMFAALQNATATGDPVDNMTVANLTGNATAGMVNETGGDGNVTDGEAPELVDVTEPVSEEGAVQAVEFEASEEMTTYRCTIHPTTMVGDVSVGNGGM